MTELNIEPYEITAHIESDIDLVLSKLRVSYPNNIIKGHLNISSIRNKFEMLQFLLADYIDVLMISDISMVHFHIRNSKFMVLEVLTDWVKTIEEEEYYCLQEKI